MQLSLYSIRRVSSYVVAWRPVTVQKPGGFIMRETERIRLIPGTVLRRDAFNQ